jgi:hypothetical protein
MVLALPMARSQRVRRELRDRGLAAHRQTAVKARVGGAEAEIFSRYSIGYPGLLYLIYKRVTLS